MNNLMLRFSGVDLSRLRALVAEVAKEVALVPGGTPSADGQTPKSALDTSWSRLVAMLDLGPEPQMRTCPVCESLCMLKATRCSHCWNSLAPVVAGEGVAVPQAQVGQGGK